MNFYCDSGGVIFHVDPERIFQGSAGANKIRFVGQFPSNAQVLVSYKLPNGLWTVPKYMTFVAALEEVQAPNGGIFCVWESLLGATPKVDANGAPVLVDGVQQYELDYTITQNAGTVDVQFFVYAPAEQSNVQNGVRLATEISSITVEKGVPVVVPEYSETDDYEVLLQQILNALTGIVSEYQDVEQRLTTAENNIGVLQEDTANLRTELDELTEIVDDLDTDLTAAEENITNLQEKSIEQQNQINVLSETTANITNDLLPIKRNISDLQDDVSGITTDVQNIREALDLAEITETVEVTDKYNSRQTANGLTLYPEQPTTLLKVEGDTIATINRLDLSSVNNSILEITENGKKITTNGTGSYVASQIGVLQDLCPTIHIGDIVYLYCKDGASILPNGLVDANMNVVIPVNTATTITAEMLATTVHLGVIPFVSGFVIEDLQITKVQNAPWTPYFEGLKSAEFAGIEITGKNLFNPNRMERDFGSGGSDSIRSFTPNSLYVGVTSSNLYYPYIGYKIASYDYNNGNLFVSVKPGGESYGLGFNFDCNSNENYCVRFNAVADGAQCRVAFYRDGIWISGRIVENMASFTTPENCNQFIVIFTSIVANTLVHFTDIQVQIGTTATGYVPYIEPTEYAFPNTVNPLGQTIDFENKKIVTTTVEFELTENENWQYYGGLSSNGVSIGDIRQYAIPDGANGICTDAKIVSYNEKNAIRFLSGGLFWIGALDYLGFTTEGSTPNDEQTIIDQFKAYLAQRANNGNPITIRCTTTNVVETEFTAEQTAAGDSYLPYTGGTETVDNANAEYSVENNITQEYDIVNKIGG